MKLEVSSDLIPSMGITLVFKQVNITAHRLLWDRPLLVLRGDTDQGPNTFSTMGVPGTEAICWQIGYLLYFSRAT